MTSFLDGNALSKSLVPQKVNSLIYPTDLPYNSLVVSNYLTSAQIQFLVKLFPNRKIDLVPPDLIIHYDFIIPVDLSYHLPIHAFLFGLIIEYHVFKEKMASKLKEQVIFEILLFKCRKGHRNYHILGWPPEHQNVVRIWILKTFSIKEKPPDVPSIITMKTFWQLLLPGLIHMFILNSPEENFLNPGKADAGASGCQQIYKDKPPDILQYFNLNSPEENFSSSEKADAGAWVSFKHPVKHGPQVNV